MSIPAASHVRPDPSPGQAEAATSGQGASPPPPTSKPGAAELGDETRGRRRVLVVDDNADAASTLRDALEILGHTVEVAYDGPEALAAAEKFRPDAVLCDIGLPGMDGCEVAFRLRRHSELGSAFLIALTGYSLPSDLERSREAGFDVHVVKPPNISELHELLVELPSRATSGRR